MIMVLFTLAVNLTVMSIDCFYLHLFQIMQFFLKSLRLYLVCKLFFMQKTNLHDAIDMCVGVFF